MEDGRRKREYAGPWLVDYGGLEELTGMVHPMFGTVTNDGVHDLSFSGTGGGSTQTTGGGDAPQGGSPAGGVLSLESTSTGANPNGSPTPGGPESGIEGANATNPLGGGGGSASGASGGGSSGTGAGSSLPFTGFAAGVVAAVGTAITTAGVALRRAVRRR
jgi:hypothetical protein